MHRFALLPVLAIATTLAACFPSTTDQSACTSGQYWVAGYGPEMMPGASCGAASCHGQSFAVAGTVYPSAHEPDDCDGVNAPDGGVDAPDAAVLVTGSDGTTVTMLINPAGNFLTTFGLSPPFTAKVVNGNGVLAMTDAVAVGDCNSCHTASGTNGAPGRIMLP